jgi:flagellar hook-associated protein 1 FlgK
VSSIFGSLTSASNALEVQRRGLEIAGQNIANVNTVGYSRRVVQLAERPPAVPGESGRGVEVAQIVAVRDLFLEARVRLEQQALAQEQVRADALSVIEVQLGQPGNSLDAQLSAFFNSFSALAEDPASLTFRDAAVRESDRLAQGMRDMAGAFERARRDADVGVRSVVDDVNRVVTDIVRLNDQIGASAGLDVESLVDQRNVRLQQLSDLVDITVTDASGVMTVSLSSGHALLSGSHIVGLEVTNDAGTGLARVMSRGEDVTAGIAGGQLKGWLSVRDDVMPVYQGMLDQLAEGVATAVNAVHTAGTDANGDPGVALFTITPGAGAAASMQVNAAVMADAQLIVAAGATANAAAREIAGLRDEAVVGGTNSASEYWAQIVYRVGGDAVSATRAQEGRQQVVEQLQRLREATSGVSLDEEAASLMRFQRAYEANARYFATISDVLDILMGMVTR